MRSQIYYHEILDSELKGTLEVIWSKSSHFIDGKKKEN